MINELHLFPLPDIYVNSYVLNSQHTTIFSQFIVFDHLPGAGELIIGPTVLGEAMAAGNLICASPPYLIKTRIENIMLLVCKVGLNVNK